MESGGRVAMRRNRLLILCLCLSILLTACQRSPAAAPTEAAWADEATLPPSGTIQEQPMPTQTPTGKRSQSDLVATDTPSGAPQPEASATPAIESPTPPPQDTVDHPHRANLCQLPHLRIPRRSHPAPYRRRPPSPRRSAPSSWWMGWGAKSRCPDRRSASFH